MEGLRPLGIGELLDAAIRIYRSRAKTLLLAVAVPMVPVLVFTSLVNWSSQSSLAVDPATGTPEVDGGDLALSLVGLLVALVATVVASSIATAACYRSISGAYVGDDPDWRESLRFGLARIWSVLGLTAVTTLATLLGLLVCLVGVIVPLALFAVAMPVLLVEGTGVGGSLRRSRALARDAFWRVLGIVLLGALVAGAFQAALSAPLIAMVFVDVSPLVEQVVTAVVTAVATILVTPFSAALTMALYVDLRVRKEGFDLALWAQRLGAAPAHGFPTQPGASAFPSFPGPGGPAPVSWMPGGASPGGWSPPPAPPPPPPPPPAPAGTPTGWAPPPDDGRS